MPTHAGAPRPEAADREASAGPEGGVDRPRPERRRGGELALIGRATVAVVVVTAALARRLMEAAAASIGAALGRPRPPARRPAGGTPLEETVARAIRSLL